MLFETLAAFRGRPTEELTQSIVSATATSGLLYLARLKPSPERQTELLKKCGIPIIERIDRW